MLIRSTSINVSQIATYYILARQYNFAIIS